MDRSESHTCVLFTLVAAFCAGCGMQHVDASSQSAPGASGTSAGPVISAETKGPGPRDTFTVEFEGDVCSFETEGHFSLGADIYAVRPLLERYDRAVIRFDATTRPETIAKLVESYRRSHGSWIEMALAPDSEYAGHEATISLDKDSYAEDEPILLTIDVSREVHESILTPAHVRIVDERGKEVNTYLRPVSGHFYMTSIWPSGETSNTIDLTDFREPADGTEYVWRFAPGKYRATYHFRVGYPEWKEPFHSVRETSPPVWGPRKSNTVSFEVRASGGSKADTAALLDKASALAVEKRWDEAVSVYKYAIVSTADLASLRGAIEQIYRIRSRVGRQGAEPDPEWLGPYSLRLGLVHASEADRRGFCERYIRAWHRVIEGETDAEDWKFVDRFPFGGLFVHPQFRSILEEEVRRPEKCAYPYAEVYVGLPGEKEPAVMAGLLPKYPQFVLQHYAWHKAPLKIVPLLPAYFKDDRFIWESGDTKWRYSDAAFKALELAAGLDLSYGSERDRIGDRVEIHRLLRYWWWRHRHRFGVTKSAGPEIVSARIAAIKKADVVLEASVDRVEPSDDGGRSIRLTTEYTIKGGAPGHTSGPVREPPDGPRLPLRRGTRVVACLVFDGPPEGKGGYRIVAPHGLWVIE